MILNKSEKIYIVEVGKYMFTENENVLNSLTYEYRKGNGARIGIRIHQDDFCILEDMLAVLVEIEIIQLHGIILQLIKEGKIVINKHIIYHAWYGSSGGKLYKMRSENIEGYNENLQESCLEDDKLKMVISSEAIKTIFEKIGFIEAESFLEFVAKALEDSRMFSCFVQGVICGVDDSIFKINFGNEIQGKSMCMPDNNDFLREYWSVLDVFSFNYRFCNAIIKDQIKINTLISKRERGYLSEFSDVQDQYSINRISKKVNKTINIFRVIRLVTKKPIWCSELIRRIDSGAVATPNPLILPNPYDYSKEDMYSLSNDDVVKINQLIDHFSIKIDDTIIELALKNYDYSFFVPEDVAIVLLVTCLEILFHPGDKNELKNRVARNAAVFLGNSSISSRTIFDNVKNFYDIRSSLVHSGIYKFKKIKKTKKEIIYDLRSVVSEAIINYKLIVSEKGIKRDDFFYKLISSGFNSEPFSVK